MAPAGAAMEVAGEIEDAGKGVVDEAREEMVERAWEAVISWAARPGVAEDLGVTVTAGRSLDWGWGAVRLLSQVATSARPHCSQRRS